MTTKNTDKNRLTPAELKKKTENLSESDAIAMVVEYTNSQYPKRMEAKKPILPNGATSDQAMEYANNLKAYEDAKAEHDALMKEYQEYKKEVDTMLEYYITDAADLKSVPDVYRDKVYRLAYRNGHSSGMYGVYQNLLELVEIFN